MVSWFISFNFSIYSFQNVEKSKIREVSTETWQETAIWRMVIWANEKYCCSTSPLRASCGELYSTKFDVNSSFFCNVKKLFHPKNKVSLHC
mmetsp:Transcript_33421/g.38923  ORF Transcript_33421/g.38923 Transcript_33421/m.38923 type:complete len:91 (-) Transcript_33421:140-412(-)